VERFERFHLPVVSVETGPANLNRILVDNLEGAELAAEYLFSKGHRTCLFLGEKTEASYSLGSSELRERGFSRRILELGGELLPSIFHKPGFSHACAEARSLFSSDKAVDAVFCSNDIEAAACIKTAREQGVRIPEDIAVLGFDNIEMAQYMGISTVDQFLLQSGKSAVDLLLSAMKQKGHKELRLGFRIVERESA
jgi:DNA-binding LacI/PurR family transcriptional regulator